MKTTKKILAMLLALAMIMLLAACGTDTPAGNVTASNGGEGNNLDIVDTPDTPDSPNSPDTHIDRNPNTDPPVDSPDGSEVDTFDETETVTLENAVVVSATMYAESEKIGFSCAAIIEGYPGGYSPFTFAVPTSDIEGEYDPKKLEDLTGAIVNIDFDGIFMETYPLQIAGVTKVAITGERADDNVYNECLATFSFDDCIEEEMLICEGWIVKAEADPDNPDNAVIYAMVQLGTCGVKDYVILGYPIEKIRNEAGETVDINSIEPGACFEFAYDGSMISSIDGKPIFEIHWTDMDYVTIGSENVGYTDEQYAEYEAYFDTDE